MTADELIATLALAPHPEGGFFRETWRHAPADGGRGACAARVARWRRSAGIPDPMIG
jgi:predicted cupin superfamily sugar epimerase